MLLGAMAAEHVFYGENSNGVGGDVQSTTARAAYMVGASAMAPEPIEIPKKVKNETEEETRERIMKRFEKIGVQIMNRTGGGGPFAADPIAGVLNDRDKRAMAAQIIGQAYIRAYHLMLNNKAAIEKIADTIVEKREMYGNEVVAAAREPRRHGPRGRPAGGGDMAADLTSSEGSELARPEAPLVERPPAPRPAPAHAAPPPLHGDLRDPRARTRARRSSASSSTQAARSTPARRGRRGSRAAAASARRSRSPSTSRRTTAFPTATSSST